MQAGNTLSKEAVEEFMRLYKKEYGEDISYDKASEKATKLLRLFKIIYKPIPKEWIKEPQAVKKNSKHTT